MKYIFGLFFSLFLGGLIFFIYVYSEVRFEVYKIIDYKPKLTTQIYDRNGDLIANIFDEEHRFYVKYNEIPPRVVEALLAIEDTAFFEHEGINPEAIFRAIVKDIQAMKLVEGASTLTQQLIKNAVLSREKKIMRKIKEAVLAFAIESKLSKEEILERYLNHVYFGHGYYGIKTAALGYFHKNLDELTLKEISMLVGSVRAPSNYDPTRRLNLSLARANKVISRMSEVGWITPQEYTAATKEVPVVYDEFLTQNKAPYVVDEIIKNLSLEFGDLKSGGYKIISTIDLKLQDQASKALKYGYENILQRGVDEGSLNGAVVATIPQSGEILALVGGIDYEKSKFNRATMSKRQPGSAIKSFIYQRAIDLGYSPSSKIADISRVYESSQDGVEDWKPQNYEGDFEGLVSLKYALTHSRNLATINLVNEVGLEEINRYLTKIGFENVPLDLSISLGSFGVSPLDFAGIYSIFPNFGEMTKPIIVKKVIDFKGQEKTYEAQRKQFSSPKQVYLGIDMLKNVVLEGTGKSVKTSSIEIGGKTGTTNSNVDAWFCGFTPELNVVVWFGKDDNTPMKRLETGGRAAGPVFKRFVENYIGLYPQTKREFDRPDGVYEVNIGGKKEFFTDISKPPKKDEVMLEKELVF